ncbi:hypothetical protein [Aliikangiella coralliicola]|uniref:Uncharacterized protein n=1 Tax=Aliikangiella coralliicola TaxID=2592383 RepID=A0A545UFK1_9GAMM|nr:hypothetical protein [Aliikangiella coralliicola]TQV88225.1 hypothetical protein FLL46_06775 [Aliikangiella coralliicola]
METTVETQQQKDINTILANPFVSAPVLFNLQEHSNGGLLISSNFLDTRNSSEKKVDNERLLSGSIVANPSVIGSSAQVIAMAGKCHGKASQRLLVKASSPNAPQQHKTLDFFPIFGSNYKSGGSASTGENLGLRVVDGFLTPTRDSADLSTGLTIPLIVGPESAVIGDIDQSVLSDLNALNVPWGNIFNIAKKVLPVVAKSGYEIYQELSDEKNQRLADNDVSGIFDTITSVAKIAVPIAGSILGAL